MARRGGSEIGPCRARLVDDLDAELAGKTILIAPNSPSPGVRVAFIVHDGAPVEFLEFQDGSRGVDQA